jgi:alanyl-tRNA synthetase
VLGLPLERLWVTIYQDDDEAYDIWVNEVGVAPDKIVRLGKADNFWEIGSGPCGPCSEIYYDRGEQYRCDSPTAVWDATVTVMLNFGIWFSLSTIPTATAITPPGTPQLDTGMGLERIACIMQGVENLFEVDTVARIMDHICEIGGVTYRKDAKTDVSLRVITDHIRSTTMLIGDGVVPSNEGRGYVLRRLLRRAARHGRLLGITKPFLYAVCETVVEENKTAYPV